LLFKTVQQIHELLFESKFTITVSDNFILNTLEYYGYDSYSLDLSGFVEFVYQLRNTKSLRKQIFDNLQKSLLFNIKEKHMLYALENGYKETYQIAKQYLLEQDEIFNHDILLNTYIEKVQDGEVILKDLINVKRIENRSCWTAVATIIKLLADNKLNKVHQKDYRSICIDAANKYIETCKSVDIQDKHFLENACNTLFYFNKVEIINFIVDDLENRLELIFRNSMINFSNYDRIPYDDISKIEDMFHEVYKPRLKENYNTAYLNRFFLTYLSNLVKNKSSYEVIRKIFTGLRNKIEKQNDDSKRYYVNQVLRDIENAYINKISKGLEHEDAVKIIRELDI
jgi:hypothetical protein